MSRYAPYKSDSESDTTTDTESDSDYTTSSEEGFTSRGPDLSALATLLSQTGNIDLSGADISGVDNADTYPITIGYPINNNTYSDFE